MRWSNRAGRRVESKSAPGPHEASGEEGTRGGAAEWTRTTDLLITNQLLYQLSYSSAEASDGLYGAAVVPAKSNVAAGT